MTAMATALPSGPEVKLTGDQRMLAPVERVLTDAVNADDLPRSYRDNARRAMRWSSELLTLLSDSASPRDAVHTKVRNLASVMQGIEGYRRDSGATDIADDLKQVRQSLTRKFRPLRSEVDADLSDQPTMRPAARP
ncbi:MAG: hypothetical protein CL558_06355 [Alphaproteobacteria bacterium]|nr:hypothetical protein [Alphaproteobacteria bacterium]MAX95364.1 hypothetical protein [Alphaproteobacteria bacterium]MBN53182.1 hypothetical protein [Alphaproteobacteria bacterium]|tara:strand:- start:18184 stop:18591 length:408 start_codon:yes stop_codon:yes gene_type:complete